MQGAPGEPPPPSTSASLGVPNKFLDHPRSTNQISDASEIWGLLARKAEVEVELSTYLKNQLSREECKAHQASLTSVSHTSFWVEWSDAWVFMACITVCGERGRE